jgi:ABC-2 type transport system permease protein
MKESFCHIMAVAKREWRAYFDSPVAYVFIIIFLMLAGFFTFSLARFYEAGQADLGGFFEWHPWLYMILVPAVAMRLWAEERRSGTIELLFTVSVTPLQALLGKFIAAWLFIILALVLTFPIVFTAVYLGSPDIGTTVSAYFGSALLAGAYIAAGMFTSALTRNQVISFILAVVIGLFLILAGFPPVTDLLASRAPVWLVDGIAAFSFMPHFETLRRGVIDLRDMVYFASIMAFMLFCTQVVLKTKVGK